MRKFMKFVVACVVYLLAGLCVETIMVPYFSSEKTLFFEVAFPLDWRNSNVAYCIVNIFLFTETFLTMVSIFFSILIWYLLLNCSLRYDVLGSEIRNMGQIREERSEAVTIATDIGDTQLERLLYFVTFILLIAELFMITNIGNEIKLSSNCLSYSLFESDWYNQPQATKKCIIIFGECLNQPQELIVGKLYPLTLETFSRILNSAYSMFNILKSFKQ